MKFLQDKSNHYLRVFDTMQEIRNQLHSPTRNEWKDSSGYPTDQKISSNSSWHGGIKSGQEAEDAYFGGWYDESFVKTLSEVMRKVRTSENMKQRERFNVAGIYPDVSRFMLGLPDCMVEECFTPVPSKIVKIIYVPSADCRTSGDTFLKALKGIVRKVLTLESKGYRVDLRIFIYFMTDDHKYMQGYLMPIKAPDRALNIKRCMFAMGHPAMLRVIGFKLFSKDENTKYIPGYGVDKFYTAKGILAGILNEREAEIISLEDALKEEKNAE